VDVYLFVFVYDNEMIGRITKTLFGYDFFISYSHQDGKQYAESLELELAAIDA
jgi:hypothetical protein